MTIAVIIPGANSSRLLRETLRSIRDSRRFPDELIVVDDGSTELIGAVAEEYGVRVLTMLKNVGPAACRNRAALLCQSEVLVFLDADTCVHPDTIERMERHLAQNPELSAVIGSYDDAPRDPGLCSQYRNLAHSYVHHSANHKALTFWSGCGAVRRSVFLAAGGFDERYRRPSIEDIELGYRMSDQGFRILLDPGICVTHTKRWTVGNSIKTDVMDRGVPWMALLLERGSLPNDLNLRRHHRIAVILTAASVLCLIGIFRTFYWLAVSVGFAALALATDGGLLGHLHRRRGVKMFIVGSAMTLVQNLCKLVAAGGGLLLVALRSSPSGRLRRGERRSAILNRSRPPESDQIEVSAPNP